MIHRLAWLAIEGEDEAAVRSFYGDVLELDRSGNDTFVAGDTELHLRRPGVTSPGGAHVHFAFTTGADALGHWRATLEAYGDVVSHDFGGFESLYVVDPSGHCVEVANRGASGRSLTGIFEVVLAVENLNRAIRRYEAIGFTTTSRSDNRPRVRLTVGPFDLELWEPHRGLADALPGAHVDLGFVADADAATTAAVDAGYTPVGEHSVMDPDGHRIGFRDEADRCRRRCRAE